MTHTWNKPSGQAFPGPPPGHPLGMMSFSIGEGAARPTMAKRESTMTWERMMICLGS